jgi:hypothetical protein
MMKMMGMTELQVYCIRDTWTLMPLVGHGTKFVLHEHVFQRCLMNMFFTSLQTFNSFKKILMGMITHESCMHRLV